MSSIIKSTSYDQHEILQNILSLCGLSNFEVDVTYGNGGFYTRQIAQPTHKFDVDPQLPDVIKACSSKLPLGQCSVKSVIYDPPFLTYVKNARAHSKGKMIMSSRFSGYWAYSELEEDYSKTIREAYRVLSKKGVLVVKCQDIIHNHKMHSTHINVHRWAEDAGFRLKDMFILNAKNRIVRKGVTQKHARIYHCYFMVFLK